MARGRKGSGRAPSSSRHDIKRGRHKKRASSETRYWDAELLIPKRPAWMDSETYSKLARLRNTPETIGG